MTMTDAIHSTTDLRTDRKRLWQALMEMAKIGATPKGGVNRQAFTELDRQSRDLFIEWCRAEGCTIRIDAIGNIFARREGQESGSQAVMTGSHLDSQPTGGKFDGVYGVLAGLEVIRTLNQHEIRTRAPIEVVAWSNEEGCRFSPCMMGSGAFTGQLALEEMLARTDDKGISAGEALEKIGYRGTDSVSPNHIKAFFECHIEQGPVLEDTGNAVGVVVGALGQKWFDLTLTGLEAHAGPTPMALRRDAMLGAAEITQEVNRIANAYQPHGRGTVGVMQLHPGSRNVIPGQVRMTIDLRHFDSDTLEKMSRELHQVVDNTSHRHGLTAELVPSADFAPEYFADPCVSAIRRAAERLKCSHMDIVSGAGHDAIFMGRVTRAGMIFVPCENGISHNEIENAAPGDLHDGCNVLLHAMLEQAGVDEE
ncbi:Zn-dependent hydrolase [Halomonas campisalis]|uniref:Zn-dependent hydrolase n=1 Tax=Billgrantia campisalis TaxID=74661 RepID=A0ABS9P6Q4_9GAMM|nr:Zn-dependent hydrolase [Halomonas campisalis]MCG6656917.1 Zn-dependent hydrolase [Halomonas campisalis]MDR5862106.1 Zn-dependent hydrolase [Halomonas campisalis]